MTFLMPEVRWYDLLPIDPDGGTRRPVAGQFAARSQLQAITLLAGRAAPGSYALSVCLPEARHRELWVELGVLLVDQARRWVFRDLEGHTIAPARRGGGA